MVLSVAYLLDNYNEACVWFVFGLLIIVSVHVVSYEGYKAKQAKDTRYILLRFLIYLWGIYYSAFKSFAGFIAEVFSNLRTLIIQRIISRKKTFLSEEDDSDTA